MPLRPIGHDPSARARLPRGGERADAAASSSGPEGGPAPGAGPGPGPGWRAERTVLVVDDDPSVRRVVGAALRRVGYPLIEAGDAVAAMEQLEARGADVKLVICDFMLSDVRGVDLVRSMRALRPELAVLFITGFDVKDLVSEYPELARFPFIEKPFSVDQLTAAVDRICRPGESD